MTNGGLATIRFEPLTGDRIEAVTEPDRDVGKVVELPSSASPRRPPAG